MKISVARFDAMPAPAAEEALTSCCGSTKWVAAMMAHRPFRSRGAVLAVSDSTFELLGKDDWLEAFAHHPRIGQRQAAATVSPTAANWSSSEQAAATGSSGDVQSELAAANVEYEERFGFIFIICARGRSAEELLAALRSRMTNDPTGEIMVAAREQQQITRLRLEQLLAPSDHA